ncbi:hypothetical protein [Pectobacterium carotovorum]|uniref:hypothetical protein n=1 Tax=Pectobacterium brasiliense TaxID=180957 RepID=UPI00113FF632|nr:hypothetical protein [Pectobacterium carotovorum]
MKVMLFSHGVILVALAERELSFRLFISHLLAKAIPVRGAKFRKSRLRKLKRDFCFYPFIQYLHVKNLPDAFSVFPIASGKFGGQIWGQVGSIMK